MSQEHKDPPRKSWAREIGLVMLAVIIYLAVVESSSLTVVVWPFMTFLFWSFGVVKNAENISTIISSTRK